MAATALDLSAAAVAEARDQARRFARETPVFDAGWLTRSLGGSISVKAENLQRTGSFKVRGVAVKLAREPAEPEVGVTAASAGNHGQALAYVASELGLTCRIFVPSTSSVTKAQAIEARGATLEFAGGGLEGCVESARAFATERGATFVHPFDDPAVILGQATLGMELVEQVPDLAKVVVPIGGGGLAAGVAGVLAALRPDVEVAGVQADVCAPMSGRSPTGDVRFALADGIAVKEPGELTRPLIDRHVNQLATVSEDAIAETMVELLQRSKLVVEGAGAVSVAALRTGAVEPASEGTTVALLSGGNLDLSRVSAIARLHEAATGRSVQIATRVPDHPGGLAALLARIAAEGGNVIDVQHVRDFGRRGFHETRVEMVLEVRGAEHRDRILAALETDGYRVQIIHAQDPPNGGVEG
jgi:threonine dehydratase